MKYKLWGIMTLLATLSLAAGCAAKPASTRAASTHFLVTALDAQRLGYAPRWAMNLLVPPDETIAHVAVLGDLVVVVQRPSNWVIGIDANDGSIRWRSKWLTDAERLYQPSRSGNLIVINTGKELFHLNANTGKVATYSQLEEQVSDGPVVHEDLAIFGSVNGRVFAHDIQTGVTRWSAQMAAGILVRPIIVAQRVLVADAAGTYTLLDIRSGERVWSGKTFGRISAKPVASETTQLVYIPSEDQNLYAINRTTGRDRWIYRTGSPLLIDPILLGNNIYITQPQGLSAVDANTGNVLWTNPNYYKAVDLIGQRLIVNASVYLMILDATTGKTLSEVPFIAPIQEVLPGENDSLVIVSPGGKIERLDPHR